MDSTPGLFLALDGGEGCGKSTQTLLLRDRLTAAGTTVHVVRDPGSTHVGELVRNILLDPANDDMAMRCEMLLYMAARAQMMSATILPALTAGHVVLCDRFVSSTLAYQLGGEGLTAANINAVAEIAIQNRWPDLTVILDMPPDKSIARVMRAKDRIEQRPLEYHKNVRDNYRNQAAADPHRVKVVAADRDAETVHRDIWATIEPLVQQLRAGVQPN